ncbi:MAG: aminopeptidase P family protein [Ignavibacteriae bacterium]|nr:aminopeptidase P family protein [Ignavibacteriota bacterium]NOG99671.1 aminopeptidase P family protein [Ignavibacteriota bacterium]
MLVKEKVEQAKNILKEFDVDCWITFVRESQINGDPTLAFLVEADLTWHSAIIITKSGKTHAIVGRYDVATVEELGAYDKVVGFVTGAKEPLHEFLNELNPKQIALNYSEGSEICDGITHGMFTTMQGYLSEINMADRIISAENIVSALRERKSPSEVENIKSAIKHTEEIFELVHNYIKPGVTEKEIASFIKAEINKRELEYAWEETVCPAVFTGPDTAGAHFAPTDKKVERGHILNMDFGVKVNGYCSDMQRTFYIMKENETSVPDDVQKGFDTIVNAIELSKQGMKPGVQALEIDAIARKTVVDAGYEEFPHGLGHQVGRFSHDGTALLGPPWEKYAQKPFKYLEEGMVFTIEPRLTVENRGTATIEEMVIVTSSGADWLTTPQKDILIIT